MRGRSEPGFHGNPGSLITIGAGQGRCGAGSAATQACPGSVSMGPQAMDGNLQVTPGTTLQAGYDFILPGNNKSLNMDISAARVTFAVACVSGVTPSASTLTVTMPAQSHQISNDQWYPSGDQSSPLVYQGQSPCRTCAAAAGSVWPTAGPFIATLA